MISNRPQALFVEEIYYIWMHWVIKTAFLLFYLRFANTRVFTTLVYCTMGLNTLFAIITWLLYCLQCVPLDAYFHPAAHPTVKCLNRSILAFVPAAFVSYPYVLNDRIDLIETIERLHRRPHCNTAHTAALENPS
jgi:hypothetical protein